MKATLSNYRQSPRKVRLVTDAVKGKSVADADATLTYMVKRGALPIQKLIKSAAANAVNAGADVATLVVKNIEVNKGLVLKRSMPRAMGRATPINKRSSHVTVTLEQVVAKEKKVKKSTK
jgi:large subunit ribosomal protein L22